MLRFFAAAAIIVTPMGALAAPESVVFSFPGTGLWTKGATPLSGVIRGPDGSYYGTATNGGAFACNCGVVYRLTPSRVLGKAWTETVLHVFTGYPADGALPMARLIFDAAGNLYGTTLLGGAYGLGGVFRLSPPAPGGSLWTETLIHDFALTDGALPHARLAIDAAGNLYGTTLLGGAADGGAVFRLSPPVSSGSAWGFSELHGFAAGVDGAFPLTGVTLAAGSLIYGTTSYGGAGGTTGGTVFQLAVSASAVTETVLHSFTGNTNKILGPVDGAAPSGELLLDSAGQVYGVTANGGSGQVIAGEASNAGAVFRLTPPAAAGSAWTETLLHGFNGTTQVPATTDGAIPSGQLIADASGALLGTTIGGGSADGGTAYRLSPQAGHAKAWRLTTLHNFSGFPDGLGPVDGLTQDGAGNVDGVTENGTASSANGYQIGTVYRVRVGR